VVLVRVHPAKLILNRLPVSECGEEVGKSCAKPLRRRKELLDAAVPAEVIFRESVAPTRKYLAR
jgi:hypothetical protein